MKQGLKFILPIKLDINLDEVQMVEFIFEQGDNQLYFTYPSETAKRRDPDIIDLVWTPAQTYMFQSGMLQLDTRITLIGTEYNPETPIINICMNPTLFEEEGTHD